MDFNVKIDYVRNVCHSANGQHTMLYRKEEESKTVSESKASAPVGSSSTKKLLQHQEAVSDLKQTSQARLGCLPTFGLQTS